MSDALKFLTPDDLQALTVLRPGETKLGEKVKTIGKLAELEAVEADFVLLGICEDIGIRANLGHGGAARCWHHSLKALLNLQSNRFLSGESLVVLGALEFPALLAEAENLNPSNPNDLNKLRELTATIDEAVYQTVEKIAAQGKIPILIGGGHNNAYGNIRGVSSALREKIAVLNIDPHTDYRQQEGRHSGNGFRYAREDGYLDRYAVYGLHEGYNGESILAEFEKDSGLHFTSFENILHQNEEERYQRFADLLNWLGTGPMGLELDLDSLTRFPVSALNPSGFGLNGVRALVRTTTTLKQPRYFHICEGSPGRAASEQEKELLGKSIAYLVADFVKAFGG